MIIAENTFRMGYIPAIVQWPSGFTPVIGAGGRDDVAVGNILNALVATQRAVRRITGAPVQTTSIVYADVPNLIVAINRVGQVMFEYYLQYVTSVPAEGIGVQLAFSGTANGILYAVDAFTDQATRAPLVPASSFGSGLAPYATGPGGNSAAISIKGSCNVTAIGDLSLQIRAATGGVESATALIGSWGFVSAIS